MLSFYDNCNSIEELRQFLNTATMSELVNLSEEIHERILNDDLYSPIWEYIDEIDDAITLLRTAATSR